MTPTAAPKISCQQKEAPSPSHGMVHGCPSPPSTPGIPQPLPEYAGSAAAASQSWWTGPAVGSPRESCTADWRINFHPPGGFVNLMHNPSSFPLSPQIPHQPDISQNFHLFGAPTHYIPFSAPQPSTTKEPPSGALKRRSKPINVESGDDDGEARTGKRLSWTPEEDERLMSAWLHNSNDSISGNFRKNDQYWGAVTAEYNSNTPKNRQRQVKQAMCRWHRVNKMVNNFHSAYMDVSGVYASGQSEKQLMEKVHKMYEKDNGGPFLLLDTWKAVRYGPKWQAYNAGLNGSNKRDLADLGGGGVGDKSSPIGIDDIARSKGTKAAKAERDGKFKGKLKSKESEELDKYYKVQTEAIKGRTEVLEVQKRIAADKLESSRLIHLAAKEKKEAKTKAKMLEEYNKLITHDTRGMPDDQKAEHMMAIKLMKAHLFTNSH